MSDKAPEYFQDLGLSDQVFNESDMLGYSGFEGSKMSESDRALARMQYVAAIDIVGNAVDDFYAGHSIGEKLDAANALVKDINSPELKNRALRLIELVRAISFSGNVGSELNSVKNFIQVESAYHNALRTGSSADDACEAIAKCETDVNFSGNDAAELSSAKAALLGLSKLVISNVFTSKDYSIDAWFDGRDTDMVFPEDAIQNKLIAAINKRSSISVIERIGLIAQAEALLSTIEAPEQVSISRGLIDRAKNEVLLKGVAELRKDVMRDIRASNGVSAKRHIAKARLLTELMSEGDSKRAALKKVESAEEAFGFTINDHQETRNFDVNVPDRDDDLRDLDDNVFVKPRKGLIGLTAIIGLLALLATAVATHQDETENVLSTIGDGMSERFIKPADRMINEFSAWIKSVGENDEEKAAAHEAAGILNDTLKAGADKEGGDLSSLAPILPGVTTSATKKPAPEQQAVAAPEADENAPEFKQIDTAIVHFGYTDDGKVVATGKIDFRRINGTFELVDKDFDIDGVSYIKLRVTTKMKRTVEIFVLSPAEIPKDEVLANSVNGTFNVPVYTFLKNAQ
ncbi:MAG: hypothetical protein WCT36_00595 [Candidatus Gracilibacteria bacterium]|jgi:hypothetical protein